VANPGASQSRNRRKPATLPPSLENLDGRKLVRSPLIANRLRHEIAIPSLSTSGETLTIEESMSLEGENGERRTWRRARMELGQRLRLLPPAAKVSLA
jgi:hypothetical protein